MAWYKLYAGLGGGFGGANYQGTYEFEYASQASEAAYELAVQEYESYEGLHGLRDFSECMDEAREELGEDASYSELESYANDAYHEEVESWISYYAVEASGPDDTDDEEEED